MLDSIYHMTNALKSHFWRKNVIILSLCAQRCYGRHNDKPLVIYRFYCMTLFYSQMRRHMINIYKVEYVYLFPRMKEAGAFQDIGMTANPNSASAHFKVK